VTDDYDAVDDVYCYPGSTVLRNRLDIREQDRLEEYIAAITFQRADEPFPEGRLDYAHFLAIHHHLFQDVFDWAGKIRTVRISKQGNPFCYPEYIDREMRRVFAELETANDLRDLDPETFARKAAHLLAELNAIHPFREGNGRTQNTFLTILAVQAGYPLDLESLNRPDMMRVMIASFGGDEEPLARLIRQLMHI
jgi:cell filamentation protein